MSYERAYLDWRPDAAHTLGFDKVRGRLVADPRIQAHIITIDVTSPAGADGQAFKVNRACPTPCLDVLNVLWTCRYPLFDSIRLLWVL